MLKIQSIKLTDVSYITYMSLKYFSESEHEQARSFVIAVEQLENVSSIFHLFF